MEVVAAKEEQEGSLFEQQPCLLSSFEQGHTELEQQWQACLASAFSVLDKLEYIGCNLTTKVEVLIISGMDVQVSYAFRCELKLQQEAVDYLDQHFNRLKHTESQKARSGQTSNMRGSSAMPQSSLSIKWKSIVCLCKEGRLVCFKVGDSVIYKRLCGGIDVINKITMVHIEQYEKQDSEDGNQHHFCLVYADVEGRRVDTWLVKDSQSHQCKQRFIDRVNT
ncbi:hypothetical protein M8C21_016459 [Ambrosia artemisiifolia]|uniref:Uncharacterized protein n=1 Tax=Ambrosia artemisiifolia TaxID=4212 RepID=A0AAD5DAN7_AMBAR|nr:hypothetical protein M8C21_016459 [Ambrosia artemisiifolia]